MFDRKVGSLLMHSIRSASIATGSLALAAAAEAQCTPAWTSLDGAPNGYTHDLVVFDDDASGPRIPALYIGGQFTQAGGQSIGNITRWTVASGWESVGGGTDGEIRALLVHDDDGVGPNPASVFAGGLFTTAGGVSANSIAKWDGTQWWPLGSGIQGLVEALVAFDEDGTGPNPPRLFASGIFGMAGGVPVPCVARWDGVAWTAIPATFPSGSTVTGFHAMEISDHFAVVPGTSSSCSLVGYGLCVVGEATAIGLTGASENAAFAWDGIGSNDWEPLIANYDPSNPIGPCDDPAGPFGNDLFLLTCQPKRMWDQSLGIGVGGGCNAVFACWRTFTGYCEFSGWRAETNTLNTREMTYVGNGESQAVRGGNFGVEYKATWFSPWLPFGWTSEVWDFLVYYDDGVALPYHGSLFVVGQAVARRGRPILNSAVVVPANLVLAAGSRVSLTVTVDGVGSFGYQWRRNGVVLTNGAAISGADSSSLTICPVAAADSGTYDCLVSDCAVNTSSPATLTVTPCNFAWGGGVGSAPGGLDTTANTLATHDDGGGPALYAGGDFTSAGAAPASHVARWNGTAWSALGSGIADTVHALATYDAPGPAGPALFAAGQFQQAGGVSAKHIARWDGTGWSALGAGLGGTNKIARSLVVFDDGSGPELFVAGEFSSGSLDDVASWNGTAWTAVGGGFNAAGEAHAMAAFDDGSGLALFIAGSFNQANGTSSANIVRYRSGTWTPLGSGTNDTIRALAVFDDGSGSALYAGGDFTTAGGAPTDHIARWNGTSWSAVGSGFNANVFTLGIFDDGGGPRLHAGGSFTSSGSTCLSRIARWTGTAWETLDSGANGDVLALASWNDGGGTALYAGGAFTSIGSAAANRIAKWAPSGFSLPTITQDPSAITSAVGQSASFSVVASGNPVPQYRWMRNGVDLPDGGVISGAATADLVISSVAPSDAGPYSVRVSNVCGSVTSLPADLTVVPGAAYCFGDGSGTPCPCGNVGATGNGCATSFNPAGGHAAATGIASVSADSLVLQGSGMSNSVVTYFQGTLQAGGGAGTVFGDGLRCASGAVLRLGAVFSAGGVSQYPNPGDQSISIRGAIPVGGGVTRNYQVWYRNAAAFCTPSTFNLTNGVNILWLF